MTAERDGWEAAKRIYHDAALLDPDERIAFLKNSCGDDLELLEIVESLLAVPDKLRSSLEEPAFAEAAEILCMTTSDPEIHEGDSVGHFRIVRTIGTGGMGRVYLAEDTILNRKVAIKFLNKDALLQPSALERFRNEARSLSAINHPNILTVYEIAEHEGGQFIAAEYVNGSSLREHLDRKGTLSTGTALKVGIQTARALEAAHRKGIIHRDIKPENLMVRNDGLIKVLDFGVAKNLEIREHAGRGLKDSPRIDSGMIVGTVGYMSPEQVTGRAVDERTDIWSLGVVLYEMIFGKSPFRGDSIGETLNRIELTEPEFPPETDLKLRILISRCLAKKAEARFPSAKSLIHDLRVVRRSEASRPDTSPPLALRAGDGRLPTPIGHRAEAEVQDKYRDRLLFLRRVLFGFAGAALLLAIFVHLFNDLEPASDHSEAIEIVSLVNNTGSPEFDYLAEGLTGGLVSPLSAVPGLTVRHSRPNDRESELRSTEGLDSDPFSKRISGSLNGSAGRLTVEIELRDLSMDEVLWTQRYDLWPGELVALPNRIATDIASRLDLPAPRESAVIRPGLDTDPEAYKAYLKGRYLYNKRSPEDCEKAIVFFETAVALDPGFALGFAGIADCYLLLSQQGKSPAETLPKSEAAALKAIALAPGLAEAQTAMGNVAFLYYLDPLTAEKYLTRAIELDPNYADAPAYYGMLLTYLGRSEEAGVQLQKAESLDPTSLNIGTFLAIHHYLSEEYDLAIDQCRKIRDLDPESEQSHVIESNAYEMKGEYRNSVTSYLKSISDRHPAAVRDLKYAYKNNGITGFWKAQIRFLQEAGDGENNGFFVASRYTLLGNKKAALAVLKEEAGRGKDRTDPRLLGMDVEPLFGSLRDEPEFRELLLEIRSGDGGGRWPERRR